MNDICSVLRGAKDVLICNFQDLMKNDPDRTKKWARNV
jgi:hypothetical protein